MKKKICIIAIISVFFNCEAVFIENITDENVTLLAPSENSEVTNGTIQFYWQSVTEASEYHIQIATPNFTNASQILLDSITTTTNVSKDLEIGTYQWRVKANNSGYSTNYTTHNFTVK